MRLPLLGHGAGGRTWEWRLRSWSIGSVSQNKWCHSCTYIYIFVYLYVYIYIFVYIYIYIFVYIYIYIFLYIYIYFILILILILIMNYELLLFLFVVTYDWNNMWNSRNRRSPRLLAQASPNFIGNSKCARACKSKVESSWSWQQLDAVEQLKFPRRFFWDSKRVQKGSK